MQDNFQDATRTNILTELPLGNAELGEALAIVINDMVHILGKNMQPLGSYSGMSPLRGLETS